MRFGSSCPNARDGPGPASGRTPRLVAHESGTNPAGSAGAAGAEAVFVRAGIPSSPTCTLPSLINHPFGESRGPSGQKLPDAP